MFVIVLGFIMRKSPGCNSLNANPPVIQRACGEDGGDLHVAITKHIA